MFVCISVCVLVLRGNVRLCMCLGITHRQGVITKRTPLHIGVVSEGIYLYYLSIHYVIRCVYLLNIIPDKKIYSKVDLS